MILPEYYPDSESCIIDDSLCPFKIGSKVVTIKCSSLVVLTVVGYEKVDTPGYPSVILTGVDHHNHAYTAFCDNCIPYESDVIYLYRQNNITKEQK